MKVRTTSRIAAPACRPTALLIACGLALVAGCSDAPRLLEPGQPLLSAGSGADVMFNPQPDPPLEIFRFLIDTPELIDNPNLRPWQGVLYDRDGRPAGELRTEHILPAVQHGQTLRLTQRWSFITDGTSLPAVRVEGVLNLVSGRMVLSGFADDGGRVLIQGWLSVGAVNSIGGEVMFNPQPDPPLDWMN